MAITLLYFPTYAYPYIHLSLETFHLILFDFIFDSEPASDSALLAVQVKCKKQKFIHIKKASPFTASQLNNLAREVLKCALR